MSPRRVLSRPPRGLHFRAKRLGGGGESLYILPVTVSQGSYAKKYLEGNTVQAVTLFCKVSSVGFNLSCKVLLALICMSVYLLRKYGKKEQTDILETCTNVPLLDTFSICIPLRDKNSPARSSSSPAYQPSPTHP